MGNLTLELSELSYLLQMVNARSVIGVDNARLFPLDEGKNQELLQEGVERLKAHHWIKVDPQSNKTNFNEMLCYLIAVMADPEIAIMTVRQEEDGSYQLFTHYLAGQMIVEQIPLAGEKYQLAFVTDLPTAVDRIQSLIQPRRSTGELGVTKITLDKRAFSRVKNLAKEGKTDTAIALLREEGIDPRLALSLVASIQTPTHRGMVVVMERLNNQVTPTRNLTIMQSRQSSWLLRTNEIDDPQVILETFWPHLFMNHLTEYLQKKSDNRLN